MRSGHGNGQEVIGDTAYHNTMKDAAIDLTADGSDEEERPRKKAKKEADDEDSDGFEIVESKKKEYIQKNNSENADLADEEGFAVVGETGSVRQFAWRVIRFLN